MQTNRKAIVAAIAGNAMEWYDFTVFALMTPVIKNLFFPVDPKIPGSEINALLLTTALFGSGFFHAAGRRARARLCRRPPRTQGRDDARHGADGAGGRH